MKSCCYLLIERRDKERQIDTTGYPNLTYRQKRVLLEDLAYWLLKNNWTEVKLSEVDERFAKKITNFQDIPLEVSGPNVRRLLIERAGIIREPVVGKVDFTHRTFQEYLAAQANVDEGDVGMLSENAFSDQWREVIVIAAGLSSRIIRERIIRNLITLGDKEVNHRYNLHLLAVACLETSVELEPTLKVEVQRRLDKLVPPKDMTDANALASAGELAVPFLVFRKSLFCFYCCSMCSYTCSYWQ